MTPRLADLHEGATDRGNGPHAVLPRLAAALRSRGVGAREQVWSFFVPGRIEVIGKHTDYAGGRSLTTAIDRGFTLITAARKDDRIAITDLGRETSGHCSIDPRTPLSETWMRYAETLARRLATDIEPRLGGPLRGAEIAFVSDLPGAAGLSSSSALVIAIYQALASVNHLTRRLPALAEPATAAAYLGAVESGRRFAFPGPPSSTRGDAPVGVGVEGGSQDHVAILCARPRQLVQYRYAPVTFERTVPVPGDTSWVIGSSGVRASKRGNAREAYNRAARLAGQAAACWRQATDRDDPHLAAALDSGPLDVTASVLRAAVAHDDALATRVDAFVEESTVLVPAAGDALAQGDLGTFGRIVDRSQARAEAKLGNQIPETCALASLARHHGAHAASAFGAGFGGAVWALVDTDRADTFLGAWQRAYAQAFPQRQGTFFRATSTEPAHALA